MPDRQSALRSDYHFSRQRSGRVLKRLTCVSYIKTFIGLISIQPPLCLPPSRLAILTPVNLFAFYYDDRAVHFIRKIGSKHQHVQSTPDAIAGDGSGETFVQKLIRLKAYLYIINARKSVHDILQRFFVEIQISLYPLNVIFGIHFCGSQLLATQQRCPRRLRKPKH